MEGWLAFRECPRGAKRSWPKQRYATFVAKGVQYCTHRWLIRTYKEEMDEELFNSIEAIASLHYLIRMSRNDPAALASYVDRADETLETLVLHLRLGAKLPATWSRRLPTTFHSDHL
jgi:hypothetical protein